MPTGHPTPPRPHRQESAMTVFISYDIARSAEPPPRSAAVPAVPKHAAKSQHPSHPRSECGGLPPLGWRSLLRRGGNDASSPSHSATPGPPGTANVTVAPPTTTSSPGVLSRPRPQVWSAVACYRFVVGGARSDGRSVPRNPQLLHTPDPECGGLPPLGWRSLLRRGGNDASSPSHSATPGPPGTANVLVGITVAPPTTEFSTRPERSPRRRRTNFQIRPAAPNIRSFPNDPISAPIAKAPPQKLRVFAPSR